MCSNQSELYQAAHSAIPAWHQDRIYQTASTFWGVTCASQRQTTSNNGIASSAELLSRDTSLTGALWDAGRGGAGVKDGPRNSAWQCSREKHCPRLVGVHIRRCVHRRGGKQHRKEKKQKPREKRGAGRSDHPQQPRRPSPGQSTSFSSAPNSPHGSVFRALVVRRGRDRGN